MAIELFGKKYTKEEILKRVGDFSQLGGIRSFEFDDGLRKGVRAVDFINPNGLFFTVLPDRALDISFASFKGVPFCWRSATKEASAIYFEHKKNEWLRTFFGGLLVTCGLVQVGDPCVDDGEELGLHGRITNIAAENVLADEEWVGDDYVMWVQGKIREVSSLGYKLVLKRKISTTLSKAQILIEDTVENIGNKTSPFMILYHLNFGFPLLDKNSRLIIGNSKTFTEFNEETKRQENIRNIPYCTEPIKNFKDQVFKHDIEPDKGGFCNVAFVNPELNVNSFAGNIPSDLTSNLNTDKASSSKNLVNDLDELNCGFGIGISYLKETLPYLTQWKKFDEVEYVTGIEPSNCFVRGRAIEKKEGQVKYIEPGQEIKMILRLQILANNKQIAEFGKMHNI